MAQVLTQPLDVIDAERQRRKKQPKTPAEFAMIASRGRWLRARHLDILSERLKSLAEAKIKRLIVTMPPRHGKSELCSRFFPAWYLGTHPDNRIILCSYEANYAATWGGKARDILQEYGPQSFGVAISDDSTARDDWRIEGREGGMVTAGVGGPITGKGANVLIIDDPVKNAEQAHSKTYRDKTWDWWQSTAYTRLEPNASVLVIQTRWHEDDLAGRLLREPDEDDDDELWEILNLPALAEEDTPDAMGRKPGEALWPERWPAAKLEKRKKRFGSYTWTALYQQRPRPADGEAFKRSDLRFYDEPETGLYRLHREDGNEWTVPASDCQTFATLDVAATEKQSSDYSVLQLWRLTPSADLILFYQWRDRKQTPQVINTVLEVCRQFNVEMIGVEATGVGLPVYQSLVQRGELRVVKLNAKGDKLLRSQAAQFRTEAHMVHLPKGNSNDACRYMDFLLELESFPRAPHDDTVDAFSWAAIMAQKLRGSVVKAEDKKAIENKDQRIADAEETAKHPGSSIAPDAVTGGADDDEEIKRWLSGEGN